jgi:WSC domain
MVTSTSSMTVEMCVGACSAKGYGLAALEYGSQCFCGNKISSLSSVVPDSQCEVMLCPGNTTEYCSNGDRLQVYSG